MEHNGCPESQEGSLYIERGDYQDVYFDLKYVL